MSDKAELSAVQRRLEELADQIEAIADRRADDPDDPIGPGLYDVERSLRHAARQTERLRSRPGV